MKINKLSTVAFLLGYVIAIFLCEVIVLEYNHSFGILGFLLLANAGMMLSILWGRLWN